MERGLAQSAAQGLHGMSANYRLDVGEDGALYREAQPNRVGIHENIRLAALAPCGIRAVGSTLAGRPADPPFPRV